LKKKIAMLSQFGVPIRGVSPYSDRLIEEICQIGELEAYQVDYKSPFPSFLHPAKAGTVKNESDLSWWNFLSWLRLANADFDLLHIQHWLTPMSVYLLPISWLSKRKGKKIVITVHNPDAHEHSFRLGFMETLFYRSADAIISHTEKGAELIRERTGPKKNISVIPHGIDFSTKSALQNKLSAKSKLGIEEKFKYILLFGNLRGYKGVGILVEAWKEIAQEYSDVKLIVAGRLWTGKDFLSKVGAVLIGSKKNMTGLESEFENLIKQEKMLYFPGFVSDDNIDALIRASECCVFPYEKFESQSGAACRSVGLGTPVIVSRVGGLPDLALDSTWIVEPSNIENLKDVLKKKIIAIERNDYIDLFKEKLKAMENSSVARVTTDLYLKLLE
jgi:glycosyltransferase involved in cell wall biosynthesis